MATQAPSRPFLLQLLRSLFELPWSMWGTREPSMEGQEELGAVGGCSSHGELAGQQPPCWERGESAEGESMEPLLGEPDGLSLTGSLGSSTSRSSLTLSTSDTELVVADDVVDAPGSSPAPQSVASEEGTAKHEAFGDKALEMDGTLQGLGADGEDVACSASPELMFSVDFDAEWEENQLLKADEDAAELSQWKRLVNMNRHQQTSPKAHGLGSWMELGREEEPLLNVAADRASTPVVPLLPASSDGVLVER